MATATWLAATAQQPTRPGQINQFLGSHSSSWLYSGNTLQNSQSIGSAVYVSTASQYLAQTVTTGSAQTTVGQVRLQVSTVGGSPVTATIPPLVVGLYANSGGVPTGPALGSVTLTEQYVYTAPFWMVVPLTVAGLTAATPYQLVVSPAGTGTAYYAWQQSNQTSGASTSPDGVTWTAQSYGFMYQVYDQSGTAGPPLTLTDDGGARVTSFTYNSAGQLTGIAESVVNQSGGSFFSSRTIAYSGQFPIGVS
jgi:YD repeat-containing protein